MIFFQLFVTFFLIGLFNFGGGGAMISLIQTQVVTMRGWISEGAFTDIVAISQSTPGPIGINCATYVGFEVGGVAGSAVATLAVVLPSFLIFLALVRVFDRFHTHPVFVGMMRALHPAVAGLIGAAALILMFRFGFDGWTPSVSVIADNFPDWRSWLLFAAAFAAVYFWKANPIYVILAGGVAGLLLW